MGRVFGSPKKHQYLVEENGERLSCIRIPNYDRKAAGIPENSVRPPVVFCPKRIDTRVASAAPISIPRAVGEVHHQERVTAMPATTFGFVDAWPITIRSPRCW